MCVFVIVMRNINTYVCKLMIKKCNRKEYNKKCHGIAFLGYESHQGGGCGCEI